MTQSIRHSMIGILSIAASLSASAQDTLQPLSADLVKTGLYVIYGGGGNSLLRFSNAGSILVDTKAPGYYRPLMSQVRKISRLSDLDIRVLVTTDRGPDQAGNLAEFAAARVATVLQADLVPPPSVVPTMTYQREHTLRMGGVDVRLLHVGEAGASAQSVVLFPDLKVIAVGDLYAPGAAPDAKRSAALSQVLALDFDTVVPSHGPVTTRAALLAFKAKVDALAADAAPATAVACLAPGCS